MTDLISQHLDLWTTAIVSKSRAGRGNKSPSPAGEGRGEGNPTSTRNAKYTAYGIKKLRELILELAVRGKLVPQDPNDEPARTLLDKIHLQKTRLIDEGKLKSQKGLPEISEEEMPPHLPTGWELVRLGEIINVLNGRAYKKHEMLQEGTPLLRVGNLFTSNEWYYSDLELEPDKYIDNGDLIYAWSASFGPFIWQGGKAIYHYHIWKLDLYDPSCLDKQFLFYFFTSITEKIKASGNGIAMIHMTKERMEKLTLEIPPLAEQHRIVAKVDELMVLCDQLEQQQTDGIAAHQTLVQTLLDALIARDGVYAGNAGAISGNQAADAAEFEQAWSRIADHFDTLFTTEASIDQLKQTLLQLAVMGKLVPQDPNDEPANLLLGEIKEAKASLIESGKIKKQNSLPEVGDDEKFFPLPKNWVWARLQEVIDVRDGTHDSPKDTFGPNTYPLVTSKNFDNGRIDFEGARKISAEDHFEISKRSLVEKYDILFSMIGGNLGNQVMVNDERQFSVKNVALFKYYSKELTSPFFVKKYMEHLALNLQEKAVGGAQPFVSLGFLRSLVFALPPISEQHRIVAKVDELMALCDTLKARIAAAQTTQLQLADAIVEQAVA